MKKHLLPLLTTTALFLLPEISHAQIYTPSNRTPQADNSQIGTQVSGTNNNFNIDGGLQRGQNLFHSFTDFSIPTGGSANFTNPQGNQSIITRVTGNLFSDLNGTLNTNGANFLLINPNGVVFGTNARLDVGKAFVTSTASGVDFVDAAGRNYNFGTNKAGDAPLISIDPNVAFTPAKLIMSETIPGSKGIENYGTLQTNNSGQYIGLIGGNITFNGGTVLAPGGRVDLGGLKSAGTVTTDSQGSVFSGNNLTRSDVSLTNGALVNVKADLALGAVSTLFNNDSFLGSSININANNVRLINDSSVPNTNQSALEAGLAENSGKKNVATGDININVSGKLIINNGAIFNTISPGAEGKIGDIKINVDRLDLNIGSISSINAGKGDAGNIDIKSTSDINIAGADSSSIAFTSQNLGTIVSNSYGQGDAGKITFDTKGKLSLGNMSFISSSVTPNAVGNSKGIKIDARELKISGSPSFIASSTLQTAKFNGKGDAGDIEINTTGDINISSASNPNPTNPSDLDVAAISSTSYGQGDAGKIVVNTQGKLSLSNRSAIFSEIDIDAVGNGKGIKIDVGALALSDSFITTKTYQSEQVSGKGKAGNINVTVKGLMEFKNVAGIATGGIGQGEAGDIFITGDRLFLDKAAISTASKSASGGNITVNISDKILMRNPVGGDNGGIFTNSDSIGQNSNGGNIIVNSPLIVALPGNSDISANANGGNGGKVNITSQGLFGIQYRPKDSAFTNDITASSDFGQSGKVQINTPGIDPGKDTGELPAAPNDASNQISQTCGASQRENKFYITGRGGLPPNASEPQESEALWQDARATKTKPATTANQSAQLAPPAIGWVFEKDGQEVRLIAAQTAGGATGTKVVCPGK